MVWTPQGSIRGPAGPAGSAGAAGATPGAEELTYNPAGQLTRVTKRTPGGDVEEVTDLVYDASGRLSTSTVTRPDGSTITTLLTYDSAGSVSVSTTTGGSGQTAGQLAVEAPRTVAATSPDTPLLVVKGAAGQTANLLEVQNDAGAVLASLAADGTPGGTLAPNLTGLARITSGTYTGNGAARTIGLPFTPSLVVIRPRAYQGTAFLTTNPNATSVYGTSILSITAQIVDNGFTLPAAATVSNMNGTGGIVYDYTALG